MLVLVCGAGDGCCPEGGGGRFGEEAAEEVMCTSRWDFYSDRWRRREWASRWKRPRCGCGADGEGEGLMEGIDGEGN